MVKPGSPPDLAGINDLKFSKTLKEPFLLLPCGLLRRPAYLDAHAALELQLQFDHVHFGGGAQLPELSHLLTHLVNGHFDGV